MTPAKREDHDSLRRALERLRAAPRVRSRDGFEEGVLRRVRGTRPARRWTASRLAVVPALAAAGLLAGLAVGLWTDRGAGPGAADRDGLSAISATTATSGDRERAALERRYRALERELAALRLEAAEARPVVGFVGRDDLDVVVDLVELMERPDFRSVLAAGPAEAGALRRAGGGPR